MGVWLLRDLGRLPSRVKLVVVAPGLISPEAMEWCPGVPGALLGLPLEVDDQGGAGVAALAGTGQQVSGLAQVRPQTTGRGDGWMRFADGSAAGLERSLPNGGRLIWRTVPPQLSALARAWMERAGVHCYAPPGYSVHASQGLVAITAPSEGEAPLHWPAPVGVRDLFDGWSAEGADFACPFAAGQTRLFAVTAR